MCLPEFSKRSRKKSRSVFQAYYMACVKLCHNNSALFFALVSTFKFFHTSRQISSDVEHGFDQRPIWIAVAGVCARLGSATGYRVWSSNRRITHVWQTSENFGSELVKNWQNLTKFDRVTRKFSNRSFPQYNLNGPKSCQILSIFFWCLSNFYISLLNFSRICFQIPFLAFNVRFELQNGRLRPSRAGHIQETWT